MLNNCTFQGRLVADPELRYTGNNVAVCSFSIACERNKKNANNETVTDFIPVVAWRSTAEFIAKYFNKGKMIVITGPIHQRRYEKNGEKRSSLELLADEVNFGDSKRDDGCTSSGSYGGNNYSSYAPPANDYTPSAAGPAPGDYEMLEDDDSQLPF